MTTARMTRMIRSVELIFFFIVNRYLTLKELNEKNNSAHYTDAQDADNDKLQEIVLDHYGCKIRATRRATQ